MKEKKQDNQLVFNNSQVQAYVIERTNPKTSYVIVDSPYHFGHYVFQGTKEQCEKYIEDLSGTGKREDII
jgi:hypothetical protein